MDSKTANYYAKNAARLAVDYSTVGPRYTEFLEQAFSDAEKILDVGCGTGRDMIHFLDQGKDAYGIDPSPEMLAEARDSGRRCGLSVGERFVEGALPKLEPFGDSMFDGILCTGVLMHLPEEQLFDAVYGLKRVLRQNGILLVSIPEQRPDVDPITRRDAAGRLFTVLPAAKLQLLFERVGFAMERTDVSLDGLGREGIVWRIFVFRHLGELRNRPLHLIEAILNRDQKVATYKLALFRALAEIAQMQPHIAEFRLDGKVAIPNEAIAEKWLFYYWPVFADDRQIRQGTSSTARGADVAIRPEIEALIQSYAKAGGLSAFYVDWKGGNLKRDCQRLANAAMSKLKNTIWNMPVRHAGGGNFEVLGYDKESRTIVMDSTLWRELCLTGNWIQDATLLRWAELTEQINGGSVKASTVIDCLLTVPDAKRNVEDARAFYLAMTDRMCVWTGREIPREFAVDHAIPFSLWRNNELWNLLPASVGANSHKSDRLPTYQLLQRQRDIIIHCWRGLDEALGERFRREAQTLLGRESFSDHSWEPRLFASFVEAFEITATQRGAERWEPESHGSVGQKRGVPAVSIEEERDDSKQAELLAFAELEPIRVEEPEKADEAGEIEPPNLISFIDVGDGAFRTHLPLVASLAAGRPFHGFEAGSLDALDEFDWIETPASMARRGRFVVRVAGDSMKPTLMVGDLVVFEYHRSPRSLGQIVIANLPEFGRGTDGTEAIKRLREENDCWVFESDNPDHEAIRIEKSEIEFPILGTFVGVLSARG